MTAKTTLVTRALGATALAVIVLAAGCADRPRSSSQSEGRFGSSAPSPARPVEGPRVDAPVVLVTIDGVRWKEIFEGTDKALSPGPHVSATTLVPHLHKLGTERGAFVGAPDRGTLSASGPNFMS